MAYSGQFLKISWLFAVAHSDEIADTSLNLTTAPGWTGAAAALAEIAADVSIAGDLRDALGDFMNMTELGWADYSSLNGVKVAAKSTAGLDLSAPFLVDVTPVSGVTNNVPPQSTAVLTLKSGFSFGKGNFGRMYLPHTLMPLSSGFPVTASAGRDAIAVAAVTFINQVTDLINAITTAILFPAIMSQNSTGSSGKGITEVAVGGVNDTQRRRRNRIDEVYSVEPLV